MKITILTLLLGILLIGMISGVSAETESYAVNQEVNLKLTCTINGAVPSAAATMNFSVTYPNGTYLVDNQLATPKGNGIFNYTLTFPEIGTYYPVLVCFDGSLSDSNPDGRYEVSPLGFEQTTSQGLGSVIFLVLMFGLTILFGWMGFKLTESKNLWIMGLFFLFLSVLFVVYDVWLGYEYHRNFTGLSNSAMPEIIFYIFMFLLLAGFLSVLALGFLRWKELARYIKNELKKKKEDEEFDKDFGWD